MRNENNERFNIRFGHVAMTVRLIINHRTGATLMFKYLTTISIINVRCCRFWFALIGFALN